uniref:Uncharacterized protein n=1 Tax=Fagus sylvatica TaxID=28930 RepID=A0A2N9FHJ7_FAGSY
MEYREGDESYGEQRERTEKRTEKNVRREKKFEKMKEKGRKKDLYSRTKLVDSVVAWACRRGGGLGLPVWWWLTARLVDSVAGLLSSGPGVVESVAWGGCWVTGSGARPEGGGAVSFGG